MTEGRCPSCGGPVEFTAGSAQVVVCAFCQTVVFRKGTTLEAHGRIGRVVDTDSPFRLGLHGRYQKVGFRIVGHLQKTQGSAPWDEWYLQFDDGRSAWLAESEGALHLLFAGVDEVELPLAELTPGHRFNLRHRRFAVEEIHRTRTISAEGELPSDVDDASQGTAVDATGPAGIFATLDYGTGDSHPEVYFGHEVQLEELGIPPDMLQPRKKKVALDQVRCTNCNGALELRAPDQTKRVACPYCGALLDATEGKFAVLQLLEKPTFEPTIPLGARGKLKGSKGEVEWICIGFVVRSTTVDGVRYPWNEYLLFNKARGFVWLMESNGHWSLLEPLAAGKVAIVEGRSAFYEKRHYKCFQVVGATTEFVLGEFYWEVHAGEFAVASEYVSPPFSINTDKTETEVTYTFGTYLEPSVVREAFKLKTIDTPYGIAPSQPNKQKEKLSESFRWAGLFFAALVLLFMVADGMAAEKVVFNRQISPPSGTQGSPEVMYFSPPFDIEETGNLKVTLEGAVSNRWLGVQADLVNEATNEVTAFYTEVSYYSGSDWVEGSQREIEYVSRVPAGKYVLRLTPFFDGVQAPSYRMEIVSDVVRGLWFWLAFLLLFVPIVIRFFIANHFETQRWHESNVGHSGSWE